MSSFKGDWKAQIKQVIDEPAGPGGQNILLRTIEEFIETLNTNPWLRAELSESSTPSLRSIVIGPKNRRDERNVLLSLWVTPYSVSVVGEPGRKFDDPGTLQRFFVEFAKQSALAQTTEDYRRRCLEPVQGALRISSSVPYTRRDMLVDVFPTEQEKLAQAAGRHDVVTVTVWPRARGRQMDEQIEYELLDSGGFGLSLTEEPRLGEDGSLCLKGTTFLTDQGATPRRLVANAGKSSLGSMVLGMGFVLSTEEADNLIREDPRNRQVVHPYLNGEDLNTRPDQSAARLIVNFQNWPLNRLSAPEGYEGPVAADFPVALKRIETRVKPERLAKTAAVARAPWWQFWRRGALQQAIGALSRVIVQARVGKYNAVAFSDPRVVFSEQVVVFAFDDWSFFAALQSFAHEKWAARYASMFHAVLRYVPADCFETFPLPLSMASLDLVGERYHEQRQSIMVDRQAGLTTIYNLLHSKDEHAPNVQVLRDLQVEMDQAVARTYGWDDLPLDHGFHATEQGVRFTISEVAHREVLVRLLRLNHQRYSEEAAEGLHDEGKRRPLRKTAAPKAKGTGKGGSRRRHGDLGS